MEATNLALSRRTPQMISMEELTPAQRTVALKIFGYTYDNQRKEASATPAILRDFNYDQYIRMSTPDKLTTAEIVFDLLSKYGCSDKYIDARMRVIGIHRSIIFKFRQNQILKHEHVSCLSETPEQKQQERSCCVETTTQNN